MVATETGVITTPQINKVLSSVNSPTIEIGYDTPDVQISAKVAAEGMEINVHNANELQRKDAVQILSAVFNPSVAGTYDSADLLNYAFNLAQDYEITPKDAEARPDHLTEKLRLVTAVGGHTEPSPMFPSYLAAPIMTSNLLRDRNNFVEADPVTRRTLVATVPIIFYAKEAAKAVNHSGNGERRRMIDITSDINIQIANQYLEQFSDVLDTDYSFDVEVDHDWDNTPWIGNLLDTSVPILYELLDMDLPEKSDDPETQNLIRSQKALKNLINRGENHGDGRDILTTLQYASMHGIYFGDIALVGTDVSTTSTMNFVKHDERIFRAVRNHLKSRLVGVDGITVGPKVADMRTQSNRSYPSYYPNLTVMPAFGMWNERPDDIVNYMVNERKILNRQGQEETSSESKSRIMDTDLMLGLAGFPKEQLVAERLRRSRFFVENVLLPIEESNPNYVAQLAGLREKIK